jgi:hypothetical protein
VSKKTIIAFFANTYGPPVITPEFKFDSFQSYSELETKSQDYCKKNFVATRKEISHALVEAPAEIKERIVYRYITLIS